MNKRKYILNGLFLTVLMIGTMYFVLRDQEIDQLFNYISQAHIGWLFTGLLLLLLFVTFESIIIHYLMKSLSHAVKLIQCIKYSFIGFFVSAITPSASGGQPAQIYFMKADGVPMSISSLVLIVVTVAYKAVLLILSAIMLFPEHSFIFSHIQGIEFILIFGIILNIIIVSFLLVLVFKESFAKKMVCGIILWLGRHKFIKRYDQKLKRILAAMDRYHQSADYLKSHKLIIFNVFVMTIIQRIFYFAITWAVYKAFGLSGHTALEIMTLQLIISLAVDNLPLPGGLGVSEGIFMLFFVEIFTEKFLTAGLLLSRGFNYYLIIILGGLVTAVAYLFKKKRTME